MLLEELARVLCQSDQSCSLPQRAVALFGFQAAILSPSARSLESQARVLAALKILESMESDTARNADLEQRLRIAGYREVLDFIMREGGARRLRSLWTTKVFWEDVSARLDRARDVALMVQFSHRFAKFGQPTPRQKGGRRWRVILFARRRAEATGLSGKGGGSMVVQLCFNTSCFFTTKI
jgi:hypothetical protein